MSYVSEVNKIARQILDKMNEPENVSGTDVRNYDKYFNNGNDCDWCENQYLCGVDGDAVACRQADENKECRFVPQNCEACEHFSKEELKCMKLGYLVASNSGEPCWEWHRERHEDCPLT